MDISTALAADLAELTEALDDPGVDLRESLADVVRDARLAVRSYVGLSVTVLVNGSPITLTAFEDHVDSDDIATSAFIPISGSAVAGSPPTEPGIVIYASKAGALVDFATDLAYALDLPLAACILDAHLDPARPEPGATDLDLAMIIGRATGVLIERGYTPETARAELHRLADLDGGHLHHGAQAVLDSLRDGGQPELR
jgi:hypothetical protein